MDRIKPIGFSQDDGIQILLYGQSGTGKTTLWSTFPKPILALVCSGGKKPGEARSIDTEENRQTIFQLVIESSEDQAEVVRTLKAEERKNGTCEYATVVLDHASGFQDLVLKEVLGLEEIPAVKTWGLASKQDYGACVVRCKELIRPMLDLSANIVIVAQERDFADGDNPTPGPSVGASLTPALAGWMHSAVDYIGETFKRAKREVRQVKVRKGKELVVVSKEVEISDQTEYCLRTSDADTYTTKFRVPKHRKIPPILVDPDYDKIIQLIRG